MKTLGNIMAFCMVIGTIAAIIEQPLILVYFAGVGLLFGWCSWNAR